MDFNSGALHSAEPGHLTLGELVYGYGEFLSHVLAAALSYNILGNEFVLKSVRD